MSEAPLGLEIPLHSSLASPIEIGGVPRTIAIVNATIAATISLGLQEPLIGAPLAVFIHVVAGLSFRRDPYFHLTVPRHLAIKPYLDA